MNHVLEKTRTRPLLYIQENRETSDGALTQCQKTMSPGLTFGTDVIVSSSLRCGWSWGVGRGPLYPLPTRMMPGKSGVEISASEIQATIITESNRETNIPNFQFLGSRMSGESAGTVGRKNGRRIVYAFDNLTSGKTRRVPSVGAVSLRD